MSYNGPSAAADPPPESLPLSFFSPSTNQTNIRLFLAEIAGATKMPCRFEELAGATGLKPARRALLFARIQSRSQYQHHDRFHSVTIFLKLHLGSESENYRPLRSSPHVCVILHDRLQQKHRCDVQQRVEFNTVLRLPWRRALRNELLTQLVPHVAHRHRIVNAHGKRLVETQSSSEHRVVAVDIRWAPVIRNSRIKAFRLFCINAPESLVRHPVQKVVPRLWFCAGGRRELSGIVGCAEPIKPRIPFAALDIVERAHRRSLFPRSESDLRNAYRHSAKLWNKSGRIMRKRIAIFGPDHRLHIDIAKWDDTYFQRWR